MKIYAPLPPVVEPKTYLTASAAAGATALTVANNAGFAASDYVVLGQPGQEKTELRKIASLGTTVTITTDAIVSAVSVNTPITFIKYNQVNFYLGDWSARYSTGTVAITKGSTVLTGTGTSWGSITTNSALFLNGTWYDIQSVDSATQITLSDTFEGEDIVSSTYALVLFTSQTTVAVRVDQPFTSWDDTDALAEDYYRTEYYNSTTGLASARSSITSASETTGFSEYSVRSLVDAVLSDLQDTEAIRRSRSDVLRDLNDCQRELMNVVVADVQEDYLDTYDTVDFRANAFEYPLFDDFRKLTSIWVTYDGSTYKKATPMRIDDDWPDATYSQDEPRYYLRDTVLGIKPTPTGAVTAGIKMWYERRIPSLKNDGDEIPHILRDSKRLYLDYALEKACIADDKPKASGYGLAFKSGKAGLAKELKGRDRSTNQRVEITQDTDLFY